MILNLRSRPDRGKLDSSLQLIGVLVVKQMAVERLVHSLCWSINWSQVTNTKDNELRESEREKE